MDNGNAAPMPQLKMVGFSLRVEAPLSGHRDVHAIVRGGVALKFNLMRQRKETNDLLANRKCLH